MSDDKHFSQVGFSLPFEAVEVEKHVIGAILLDDGAINHVRGIIKPMDFYLEKHEVLMEAIYEMDSRSIPIDLITLENYLKGKGVYEQAGGSHYLIEISAEVVSSANVDQHAKIVLEKSQMRILERFLARAKDKLREPDTKAQEVVTLVEAGMMQMTGREAKEGPIPLSKSLTPMFANIERLAHGNLLGLPTGYRVLDYRLGGLQNGKVYVIAGIPGSGKTVLAMNIGKNLAGSPNKIPGAVLSMEMGRVDLMTRMLVNQSQIDSGLLQTGRLPQRDYAKMALATGELQAMGDNLFVDDSSVQTPGSARATLRRLKMEKGIRFAIIDYFQLMTDDRKHKSRYDDLTQVSIGITRLAKDLDIPIIICAQLDKESAKGGVPMLGNLKETGQLGQDATSVLLIHRPAMFHKKLKEEKSDDPFNVLGTDYKIKAAPNEFLAHIIAEKNRQGTGTGVDDLFFIGKHQKFVDSMPKEDFK